MEEILASIRRIIADDDATKTMPERAPRAAPEAAAPPAALAAAAPSQPPPHAGPTSRRPEPSSTEDGRGQVEQSPIFSI